MTQILALAVFLLAAFLLIFVHIWSDTAVEYDIRQNLTREVRKNLKYVRLENGKPLFLEGYDNETEDIYFLLLDSEGTVVAGNYPEKYEDDGRILLNYTRTVKCFGETFFVRDMQKTKTLGTGYFMRGVVRKADIYSRYQTLKYLSYLSIAAVLGFVVLCGIFLARQISDSLKKMCETAETIGKDFHISRRMEHDHRFYELAVLAQAENRMLDRMESAVREQEQFTSDAAHELRTPAAVILAQCEYVSEQGHDSGEMEEAFEVIYRQSQRMHMLVSQLLRLARLDRDETHMQREEVDLADLAESVCDDEEERARGGVTIVKKLNGAKAAGDINLLVIAIANLVRNAVKFSPQKGVIEVETGKSDGEAYVLVRDHGCGMDEEEMSHIFQRFYKGDKSRNSEGIGLGLPLVQKIAQRHGGTVSVTSRAGEGSTFTLRLPEMEWDEEDRQD